MTGSLKENLIRTMALLCAIYIFLFIIIYMTRENEQVLYKAEMQEANHWIGFLISILISFSAMINTETFKDLVCN